jgi:hypothetical protein
MKTATHAGESVKTGGASITTDVCEAVFAPRLGKRAA